MKGAAAVWRLMYAEADQHGDPEGHMKNRHLVRRGKRAEHQEVDFRKVGREQINRQQRHRRHKPLPCPVDRNFLGEPELANGPDHLPLHEDNLSSWRTIRSNWSPFIGPICKSAMISLGPLLPSTSNAVVLSPAAWMFSKPKPPSRSDTIAEAVACGSTSKTGADRSIMGRREKTRTDFSQRL